MLIGLLCARSLIFVSVVYDYYKHCLVDKYSFHEILYCDYDCVSVACSANALLFLCVFSYYASPGLI